MTDPSSSRTAPSDAALPNAEPSTPRSPHAHTAHTSSSARPAPTSSPARPARPVLAPRTARLSARVAAAAWVAGSLCVAGAVTATGASANEPPADDAAQQFTFSWPFSEDDAMRPRGGTSRGAQVELAEGPSPAWQTLQAPNLSDFERDRRAILAMAGPYRASFDFLETVHFTPDATPDRPYQSWGTEYVYVAEDAGDFISLQHILVMVVENDDGTLSEPMVMKHWRQDWTYEDRDLLVYAGDDTWERRELSAENADGAWTQAVFQVDDAPRYEASGRWVHDGNYSAWTGTDTWRPLPRREHSVRDDYQALLATNRHTIVPSGWVHEENNLKMVLDAPGQPASEPRFLARELGVNRYELIDFDFSAGDRYWALTGDFWATVRDTWAEVLADETRVRIASEVDGTPRFQPLFEYAERIAAGEAYDDAAAGDFVRQTLERYVESVAD